jgi:hypothetical protein
MKIFISVFVICIVSSLYGYSQSDLRPIVGVTKFTIETETKYASAVTSKIIEMLTQSKRFQVVDRTSYDKVKDELEFQKSEAFLDSKERAKQGVAVAAQYLITGHIVKMNVYAFKNPDGGVNGFKASTSFQLKVVDVESGKSTEAQSFQSKVSDLMLSPESAVNEAVKSLEEGLSTYFTKNFPVMSKIVKILSTKKDAAVSVLLAGGKIYGLKEGDKLTVNRIEMLEGKPYPSEIGEIKITKVAGDDFSECSVNKGGTEILSRFNAADNLSCKLIIK